jgi:hypothetical protein
MFYRINTLLCELIQWTGEESVGLYRQISTAIHPQPLFEFNYNSDRPNSRIVHVRMCCGFVFVMLLIFSTPCFHFTRLLY